MILAMIIMIMIRTIILITMIAIMITLIMNYIYGNNNWWDTWKFQGKKILSLFNTPFTFRLIAAFLSPSTLPFLLRPLPLTPTSSLYSLLPFRLSLPLFLLNVPHLVRSFLLPSPPFSLNSSSPPHPFPLPHLLFLAKYSPYPLCFHLPSLSSPHIFLPSPFLPHSLLPSFLTSRLGQSCK